MRISTYDYGVYVGGIYVGVWDKFERAFRALLMLYCLYYYSYIILTFDAGKLLNLLKIVQYELNEIWGVVWQGLGRCRWGDGCFR